MLISTVPLMDMIMIYLPELVLRILPFLEIVAFVGRSVLLILISKVLVHIKIFEICRDSSSSGDS